MNRLRELDFLRGAAILLVMLRHQYLFSYGATMGWIGVDLFFVLSGFLVSGLLFKEYGKFGNINPKLFLIRRGFKIYPIYYLFYLIYLIPIFIIKGRIDPAGLVSDLTFTQNYVWGFGYAYAPSWSLAVEEHFYFGLALVLWWVTTYRKQLFDKMSAASARLGAFEATLAIAMLACLAIRIFSNAFFPLEEARNFTMTHLRIDSLLTGVLVSYLYYFKREHLRSFFMHNKRLLCAVAILGLAWTPFIEPLPSFFAKTLGFTLLYISFGILLIYVLLKEDINCILDRIFSRRVVDSISKVGYCSYSIYIIHAFVNLSYAFLIKQYGMHENIYIAFLTTTSISILLGTLMTHKIEKFFLDLRTKHYPNRTT